MSSRPHDKYVFQIHTDHFQFFLEDCDSITDTSNFWDEEALNRLIDANFDVVSIGTQEFEEDIIVVLEISGKPQEELDGNSYFVDSSIVIHSGCVMVTAPESDLSKVPQVNIEPGIYNVRVFFEQLDRKNNKQKPVYRILLWKDLTQKQ